MGAKTFSVAGLLNASTPRVKPEIKETGAATNISESVIMAGSHAPKTTIYIVAKAAKKASLHPFKA